MVQIRRKRRVSPRECIGRSIGGVLQFLAVSSVIPATFVARHALFHKNNTPEESITVVDKTDEGAASLVKGSPIVVDNEQPPPDALSGRTSSPTSSPKYFSFSTDDDEYERVFGFLNQVNWGQQGHVWGSDVVELYHCRLDPIDLSNFTAWAMPLVNHTLVKGREQVSKRNPPETISAETEQLIREEFILELLEMRAQAAHLCNFEGYQPTLAMDATQKTHAAVQLETLATRTAPDETRVVFSIIAHRDLAHLRRLITAIALPQHYILLHVERRCRAEWQLAIYELAASFDNVVVVQFGSILYETDLVSSIQYSMMFWITRELQIPYDYWVNLDGASFPLYSASDLLQQLTSSGRQVWMGALTHKGVDVHSDQTNYLYNKRVLATRGESMFKLTVRLPRTTFQNQILPQDIIHFMNKKTNSGNQAAFGRVVVEQLVDSPSVRQLFAFSKYGCCCCLEERTWIAAMGLIGRQAEALEQASVWQVWGGKDAECKSSMKNAVLTRNATICYKVEDGTTKPQATSLELSHGQYFRGNETWAYLQNARNRGILFARKFDSENALSLELNRQIEQELW